MSKDLCPWYSETFNETGGGHCFVANTERKQAGQQKHGFVYACRRRRFLKACASALDPTASKCVPRPRPHVHERERREIKPATTGDESRATRSSSNQRCRKQTCLESNEVHNKGGEQRINSATWPILWPENINQRLNEEWQQHQSVWRQRWEEGRKWGEKKSSELMNQE